MCDFLLEIELNTIANALHLHFTAMILQVCPTLYGTNVESGYLADLTGRSPPSTLPLTDLQYFSKARGVIIDARSSCA